ncbi:MAG: ROK family protein [Ignavibacteria bacterium]|nr:ROK family protein [Ignavibacteria bacterium]
MSTSLGIDVGGTSIKWGVVSSEGEILHKSSVATAINAGPDVVVRQIADVMREGIAQFPDVCGVGVGMPGVVNPVTGLVEGLPNFPGWTPQPLSKILSAHTTLKVVVENDANVAAIGELVCGAGKGLSGFLYVTLGTGVGGAVVIDGKVYSGTHGNAGEIGHIIVDAFAQPTVEQIHDGKIYRTGSLEELVGRAGILRRANRKNEKGKDANEVIFNNENASEETTTGRFADVVDIVTAAEKNDEFAREVIHETGRLLGIGICSAITVLGVEAVIIGGGISQSDELLDVIRQTIQERAISTIASRAKIIRAKYGANAGLVGAAMLSLQDSFN